ncbi:MAG: ATP-dependent DNA helicase [Lachnospiraceae bacterium]|nr:ATP-dependent DNA helicase [Lachnospiraceae bacterium]MCI9095258.1 ATP-dependent DNA helicase [Lachnospiraceae bacterium]MCI9204570.1 ATP-dependent DNA helicase [Lachnospiraceae bacterium]
MEIRISVRKLVEFILRSGNIDNRRVTFSETAMQEGGRIHRMLQRGMGADYQAEVFLRYVYPAGEYDIYIEGRADGIITQGIQKKTEIVTIDEIKGTYRDIDKMKGAVSVHLAQAKCYAYIYGREHGLAQVRVRLTYCNIDTERVRYFHFEYPMEELAEWFEDMIRQYRKWADFRFAWQKLRTDSIKELSFPFPYRKGQKELASYVYQTIYHKRKLFLEAPTGVGKTISTLFPAVKALGEKLAQRIFYLTAKTITRTVAEDALGLMRERGLRCKSITLTAKDKICFMEETECNPDYCPYAKGHFDRINEAVYELLTHVDNINREVIEDCARQHRVCPFELGLDVSLFADVVIGDYNYLFDPHVYLKRFFSEGVKEEYIFLIDEAHNLVDRGREMYSALLRKEDFLVLKKAVKDYDGGICYQLDQCNRELLEMKRECEDYVYLDREEAEPFANTLIRLLRTIDKYLEEHEDSPVKKELLEFYFQVSHFMLIFDKLDKAYVIYNQLEPDGGFFMKLLCVDPSKNLRECMARGRSSILFSATLLPIQYYKKLLGASPEDYEVYAHSVFDSRRQGLFIAEDVTSRYTRRSEEEYLSIASYIHRVTSRREGNYMIFFPSHAFMQKVCEVYEDHYLDQSREEYLFQEEAMDEESREAFLAQFSEGKGKTLLGFCVLGGIFSEGIDLKKDRLIGAIIVGTGIPMVCNEREILKGYFEERGDCGFDYAYRYPGMNKVLQAAGRVIRTAEDLGIVVLLDERFCTAPYLKMFPREWTEYEKVSLRKIEKRVERFWDEWL